MVFDILGLKENEYYVVTDIFYTARGKTVGEVKNADIVYEIIFEYKTWGISSIDINLKTINGKDWLNFFEEPPEKVKIEFGETFCKRQSIGLDYLEYDTVNKTLIVWMM